MTGVQEMRANEVKGKNDLVRLKAEESATSVRMNAPGAGKVKGAGSKKKGGKAAGEPRIIDAADANNPLASIKSVSVHNIYTPVMYGSDNRANVVWKRYAQPIGRFLLRASLPVNTIAFGKSVQKNTAKSSVSGGNLMKSAREGDAVWMRESTEMMDQEATEQVRRSVSGLGDFNVFLTYIATKPTAKFQFGFGPIFTFPTATDPLLGSGKWSAGLALVGYFGTNPKYQVGFLATWQHSFAGRKDRERVHAASIQPMFTWQLGNGLYMRSTGIIVLDFQNDNYFIPFGLGMGKVFNAGKLTFNLFVEPQFTTWHHGTSIPEVQLFCGINTQF